MQAEPTAFQANLTRDIAGKSSSGRPSCQNFPDTPSQEVSRDNVLDTIETLLDGEAQIALVEGPDGRGKTTLLAQFASRHRRDSVALFISGGSRFTYDAPYARFDIANQLHLLFKGAELSSPFDVTDVLFGTLLYEARRYTRKSKKPFYFIIDGMHEIPADDIGSRRELLLLLPIGESAFRFVFSGDAPSIGLNEKTRRFTKPYPLTLFSLVEATSYLSDLQLSVTHTDELFRVSRGEPWKLAYVRRRITNGIPPDVLLADLPSRLPEAFEQEWDTVDASNTIQTNLLAILALDARVYSVDELSAVANVDRDIVCNSLRPISFLDIDLDNAGSIRFISDTFRQFAAAKLRAHGARVTELLIAHLLQDPNSEQTRAVLPTYLNNAGRPAELLAYLTPSVMEARVKSSQSLHAVQNQTDMALNAARELGRNDEVMRLSLQKATIAEFDESAVGRFELRALAALGEFDLARGLAESALRQEDRLLLLAAFARSCREAKLPVSPDVVEQLIELHHVVDMNALGSRTTTLAIDLMHVRPDLAIDTVERAKRDAKEPDSSSSADWDLARLALEARIANRETGTIPDGAADIERKIKDPRAKRLAHEASIVLGDTSASNAIADAEALPTREDQVYVLRQWMLANRSRKDAPEVLEQALKIAIQATDYSMTAQHLREIATGLPYIDDQVVRTRLIAVVDSQAAVARELGPTEDYVRLQLIIARAETRGQLEASRKRVVELYFFINALEDFATQVVCSARLVAALRRIDPAQLYEGKEGIHSLSLSESSVTRSINSLKQQQIITPPRKGWSRR